MATLPPLSPAAGAHVTADLRRTRESQTPPALENPCDSTRPAHVTTPSDALTKSAPGSATISAPESIPSTQYAHPISMGEPAISERVSGSTDMERFVLIPVDLECTGMESFTGLETLVATEFPGHPRSEAQDGIVKEKGTAPSHTHTSPVHFTSQQISQAESKAEVGRSEDSMTTNALLSPPVNESGTGDPQLGSQSGTSPVEQQGEILFTVAASRQGQLPVLKLSSTFGRASVLFGLPAPPSRLRHGRVRFTQSPRMGAPHVAAGFMDSALPNHSLPHVDDVSQKKSASPSSLGHTESFTGGSANGVTNSEAPPPIDHSKSPNTGAGTSGGSRHKETPTLVQESSAARKEDDNCADHTVKERLSSIKEQTIGTPPSLIKNEITEDPPPSTELKEQAMSNKNHLLDANARETPGPGSASLSSSVGAEDVEEKHTPLSFQIPPAMLRAAMAASPNSAGSYYSQALYRGPEDQLLCIHYCTNMAVAENVAPYFLNEKVLGFDIEWKPWANPNSIKENASLIQVASENRIALFHISLYKGTTPEELLPPTLRAIIESPDICKVGVAIKSDFSRLEKHLGVKAKGVFELSRLHNLVEYYDTEPDKAGSKKLYALAKQVHEHLQLPLYKGSVRESDWSKYLNPSQITYAATDAYASLRIYDALEAKRKRLRPIPPRPELCDFDSSRPKSTPRAKTIRKVARISDAEQEAPEESEKPQEEEDEDAAFESAEEELLDSQELERESSESESSSDNSNRSEDPDADYIPSSQESQLDAKDGQHRDTQSIPRQIQRVGRVKLATLVGPDPGYPILPIWSSSENESDSDSAFDPPAHVPRTRQAKKDDRESENSLGEGVNMETGNGATVVENILSSLEIDDDQPDGKNDMKEDGMSATIKSRFREQQPSSPVQTGPSLEMDEAAQPNMVSSHEPASQTSAVAVPSPASTCAPLLASTNAKTPEYSLADTWATDYLQSTIPSISSSSSSQPSRIRATLPHLRAYHLWYHQHLPIDVIATHLRPDPPLAESTVCSYILQAVTLERLEYQKENMKELLRKLPIALRMGRWRWMVEKIGGVN